MKAFKGFNKDMTCRGFQYEEGKTYETDEARLCETGFHACERPLDCFSYYAPGNSVYREVELEDVSSERKDDSKIVGKKIKIGAGLDIASLCKAQFDYVKEHTMQEHTDDGAATAGNRGAATSRGFSTVGENGIACARGNDVKVMGGIGAILVIAEEKRDSYDIDCWKAFVVDGEKIKADTWYGLRDGELVELKE